MSGPFEKFVIHAINADSFTVHVQSIELVPISDRDTYASAIQQRRKFIEDAIREKLEREGQPQGVTKP